MMQMDFPECMRQMSSNGVHYDMREYTCSVATAFFACNLDVTVTTRYDTVYLRALKRYNVIWPA